MNNNINSTFFVQRRFNSHREKKSRPWLTCTHCETSQFLPINRLVFIRYKRCPSNSTTYSTYLSADIRIFFYQQMFQIFIIIYSSQNPLTRTNFLSIFGLFSAETAITINQFKGHFYKDNCIWYHVMTIYMCGSLERRACKKVLKQFPRLTSIVLEWRWDK